MSDTIDSPTPKSAIWKRDKACCQSLKPAWRRCAIIISESEEGTHCMSGPIIPRSRRAGVELGKKPHVKLIDECIDAAFRGGRTAIVHDKHLEAIARVVLTCQCAQTDSQLSGALIGRNYDRKERKRVHHLDF